MKLAEYLKSEDINALEFGQRIGLKEPNSVYRYLRGDRFPEPKILQAILRETGGKVRPEDFFSAPPDADQQSEEVSTNSSEAV